MRPIWLNGLAVAIVLAMAASVATTAKAPPEPTRQLESLTSILERIRQDVGYYEVQAALWRGELDGQTPDPALSIPAYVDPPDADHPNGTIHPARDVKAICSIKRYDFDITKVEVTVQVVQGSASSGEVGLKVPYAGSEIAMSVSRQTTATRTLVLDREPVYDTAAFKEFMASDDYLTLAGEHQGFLMLQAGQAAADEASPTIPVFPIGQTLLSLRRNLVEAAEKLPCFEIPDSPLANTIKLDFEVTQSRNRDIGFALEIVSAKSSAMQQQTSQNTITVTYAPHAVSAPRSNAVAAR